MIIIFLPFTNDSFLGFSLFGLQSIAPTLAAVIVITHKYSVKDLKSFLKEKYITNISVKLCLSAFLIPLAILLISKVITVIFQVSDFKLIIPSATKILIIAWALIAEELGWRGFLQGRIEQKAGLFFTPLIIGVIWGVWHFHYYLSGTMDAPFPLLILGCIFESYGYFIITKLAKGNILPASVWHFSGNLFINIFGLNVINEYGGIMPYLIMTFTYVVCFIGFIFYFYIQPKRKDAEKGFIS